MSNHLWRWIVEKKEYDKYLLITNHHKKNTLKNIIAKHWARISKLIVEDIPQHVYKSFNNILLCRTEKLGCHLYQCPDCGEYILIKHSCKDRFCSSCGTAYTDVWAQKTVNLLSAINTSYYFLTFTIPKPFELIAKNNKKLVLGFLFKASWYAVNSFAKEKGFTVGMISQLQTAGRWLNWHPHIHSIVTAGGLLLDFSLWKELYLSANSIRKRFKQNFLRHLRKAYRKNLLITDYDNYKDFNTFLDTQYKIEWQFDRSNKIDQVKAVVLYISRYLLKPPISDLRIKWFNYKTICFTFKHHLTNLTEKAYLSMTEFFSRLIHHVQIPYFNMTRNYGVFSSRLRKSHYEKAIELNPVKSTIQLISEIPTNFRERTKAKTGNDPLLCPKCNTELVLRKVYYRYQLKESFDDLLERLRDPPVKNTSLTKAP